MKNILLPTDFSDNSWNAIRYAVQFLKNDQCTFYLFNAYTPVIYDLSYALNYRSEQFGLRDPIRKASREKLNELSAQIIEKFGTNPTHQFKIIARFETLIVGIKELIEERHIDLVIMGTKGATGAKKIFFGSNTVQVVGEIQCPVLAIPSNFDYVAPQEILFPTDLKVDYDYSQLEILKKIVQLHHSKINVLHVSTGHDLSTSQTVNKDKLTKLLKKLNYEFQEFEDMEIPHAIDKFQNKQPVDLLVMINNRQTFFENLIFKDTIDQIGFYLTIPFLVIPLKKYKTKLP